MNKPLVMQIFLRDYFDRMSLEYNDPKQDAIIKTRGIIVRFNSALDLFTLTIKIFMVDGI